MAPIRIPEGQVFVARAAGVAAALLDAAEELGYARHEAVRTVSGGYHVPEDVAAKYQENAPEVAESNADASASTSAVESPQVQSDPGAQQDDGSAGLTDANTQATDANTQAADAGDDPKADDPLTAKPREGWSHDQFDTWAGNQEPKVSFPSGANLKQKLEISTNPPAPAAE